MTDDALIVPPCPFAAPPPRPPREAPPAPTDPPPDPPRREPKLGYCRCRPSSVRRRCRRS